MAAQAHNSVYQAVRAKHAERLAEERREEAEQARDASEQSRRISETVKGYLVEAFRSPDPERDGRTITVAEVLDRAAEQLQDQFADQPLVKADLLSALGESYIGLGLYEQAVRLKQEALEIRQNKLGGTHADTLTDMDSLALAYLYAGRWDEALALLKQTLEPMKTMFGPDHVNTLMCMNNLAEAYRVAGRLDEAISLWEQTLELLRAKLGPDHPDTLSIMHNLALAYLDAGRHVDAETLARQCLRIRQQQLPDDWRTYSAMSVLGRILAAQERFADAEPLLVDGYQGMVERETRIPAWAKSCISQALDAIIQLYDTWNKPDEAQRWRQQRQGASDI